MVSVGQMDTEHGNSWELFRSHTVPVDIENPHETVIYTTSYLQTDRSIRIAYFAELSSFLDTNAALSSRKFDKVLNSYYAKRQKYGIDDFRDMFFTKEQVLELNPLDDWERAHLARLKKYGIA